MFDTDPHRHRFDHVGTRVRCTCYGEELQLYALTAKLVAHAGGHEVGLSVEHGEAFEVEEHLRPGGATAVTT